LRGVRARKCRNSGEILGPPPARHIDCATRGA
jgi:hypothetical protein